MKITGETRDDEYMMTLTDADGRQRFVAVNNVMLRSGYIGSRTGLLDAVVQSLSLAMRELEKR